jgi:hypothetical protein
MLMEADGQTPTAVDPSATAKAAAEAQSAEIAAQRAAAEFQEWQNAACLRAAQDRAAAAKAGEDTAVAERAKWADLVPDFGKAEFGETKVAGEQAMRGSALALRALKPAAREVATVVRKHQPAQAVLVTSDLDLAGGDAAYRAVVSGLDQLLTVARQLIPRTPPTPGTESMGVVLAVGALVAKAIPAVAQLASARRSVSTFATSADDLAATVNVISVLLAEDKEHPQAVHVVHDGFRLSGTGAIDRKLAKLAKLRTRIARLAETSTGTELTSFVAAVDAFVAGASAVPAGGTRSLLTDARLRECLHDGSVEYVLLVKGMTGSVTQLVNDRKLRDDKVTVVADASISYLLVRTRDGRLVAGGTSSGSATMHGTIGADLRMQP